MLTVLFTSVTPVLPLQGVLLFLCYLNNKKQHLSRAFKVTFFLLLLPSTKSCRINFRWLIASSPPVHIDHIFAEIFLCRIYFYIFAYFVHFCILKQEYSCYTHTFPIKHSIFFFAELFLGSCSIHIFTFCTFLRSFAGVFLRQACSPLIQLFFGFASE